MTTITKQESEVRWEDVLDGTPAQVWDAITVHPDGWWNAVSFDLEPAAYVAHFAGRDCRYGTRDTSTPFAEVVRRLDAGVQGEVVDYRSAHFFGLRTPTELVRVFGRDAWGYPVEIVRHRFDAGAASWLDAVIADA